MIHICLTVEQTEKGTNLVAKLCPVQVPIIIYYKAKSALISNYMFDSVYNMTKKEKKVCAVSWK